MRLLDRMAFYEINSIHLFVEKAVLGLSSSFFDLNLPIPASRSEDVDSENVVQIIKQIWYFKSGSRTAYWGSINDELDEFLA